MIKQGKPTTVRIVRPSTRTVIHRAVLRARLADTARVGERQVLLTAVKNGREQKLHVFDAEGRRERTVALPGIVDGDLHGRSPTGTALVLAQERAVAYEVDVATGKATRHKLAIGGRTHAWLEPTSGGMLAVAGRVVWILDPETFEVTERIRPTGLVRGAGEGFVAYDREGETPLTVYAADGVTRWELPRLDVLDVIAFGDRLYTGSGYGDANIRIFDLATGKLLKEIPGRATLFEADAGRADVGFFSSSARLED